MKWQSSAAVSSRNKPLSRPRATTACANCRTAKVKCDGKGVCGYCEKRGLGCKRDVGGIGDVAHSSSADLLASKEPDAFDSANGFEIHDTMFDQAFEDSTGLQEVSRSQRVDELDWTTVDPSLDANLFENDSFLMPYDEATTTISSREQPLGGLPQTTEPNFDMFDPPNFRPTKPTIYIDIGNKKDHTADLDGTLLQPQVLTTASCQCRDDLTSLVPRVKYAVQEGQLNEVFKITREVMQRCRSIIGCATCNIGCTDLICLTAVFQQTGDCFQYIANPNLTSALNVNFGGLEIPIADPRLRAMLVLNLVDDARTLLSAISNRGQSMLKALVTPTVFATTNIAHLESVIAEFRGLLDKVAEDATVSPSPNVELMATQEILLV